MESAEFSEHIALAQLEPALYYPEIRFGKVCAAIANAFGKKRGKKGFSPADFFSLDHEPKDQSEEEMIAVLERVTEAMSTGATVRRPRE